VYNYLDVRELKKLENKQSHCEVSYGTEESYFPFVPLRAALSQEDIELSKSLSPALRVEWLIMMQKLLIKQFYKIL